MSIISSFSATAISKFTTDQIRNLSSSDFKAMTTAQVNALTSTQIAAMIAQAMWPQGIDIERQSQLIQHGRYCELFCNSTQRF